MKKHLVFVFLFFFLFNVFTQDKKDDFVIPKYQSIAIGQLSLAYRLMTLSTSLSIAKAVDDNYIVSILDNIDSTIKNCSSIVSQTDGNKNDDISKMILESIDYFISCSNNVKNYTTLHSYENLQKVRTCIDRSGKYVDNLTKLHNIKAKKKDTKNKNKK